jgi:hypothetical protein
VLAFAPAIEVIASRRRASRTSRLEFGRAHRSDPHRAACHRTATNSDASWMRMVRGNALKSSHHVHRVTDKYVKASGTRPKDTRSAEDGFRRGQAAVARGPTRNEHFTARDATRTNRIGQIVLSRCHLPAVDRIVCPSLSPSPGGNRSSRGRAIN